MLQFWEGWAIGCGIVASIQSTTGVFVGKYAELIFLFGMVPLLIYVLRHGIWED
jgi:hypothetical protein